MLESQNGYKGRFFAEFCKLQGPLRFLQSDWTLSLLTHIHMSLLCTANDDDDDDDPDRTQADISPSPVIPIATSNFRQPVPRPSLRLTQTSQEQTTKENTLVGDDDATPSQHNRTLLANFETNDDEEEEDWRRGGSAAVNTSIVQDVDVPSDPDDYDFIPGTPPSKKVILQVWN